MSTLMQGVRVMGSTLMQGVSMGPHWQGVRVMGVHTDARC